MSPTTKTDDEELDDFINEAVRKGKKTGYLPDPLCKRCKGTGRCRAGLQSVRIRKCRCYKVRVIKEVKQ